MPLLPTPEFCNNPPVFRARQVLTFALHFYIHSIPKPSPTAIHIPPSLSTPLRSVSDRLGLPPICTYSDTFCYSYSMSGSADKKKHSPFHTLQMNCAFTEHTPRSNTGVLERRCP